MADKQKVVVPPDNYGRVYIALLESDLSTHAKLCYGVMWSFGNATIWASLESIGRRMSASKPTVIKAQEELRNAGWITLLEDSKGRTTKRWVMNTPTVNEIEANGKAPLPLTVNAVDTNKELKQERKKESAPHPLQIQADSLKAIFKEAWEGRYTKSEWRAARSEDAQFLAWAKAGVTPETMKAKAARHMARESNWHLSSWHSVSIMERTWNELNEPQQGNGVPSIEDCQHPYERLEVITDYGPNVKGKCGSCGKVVMVLKP